MDIHIGNDIEQVSRIDFLINNSYKLIQRMFFKMEIEYAFKQRCPSETLTGIWCAKEAVLKAFNEANSIKNIEINRDNNGKPIAVIHKNSREKMQNVKISISISHTKEFAVATAICYCL